MPQRRRQGGRHAARLLYIQVFALGSLLCGLAWQLRSQACVRQIPATLAAKRRQRQHPLSSSATPTDQESEKDTSLYWPLLQEDLMNAGHLPGRADEWEEQNLDGREGKICEYIINNVHTPEDLRQKQMFGYGF